MRECMCVSVREYVCDHQTLCCSKQVTGFSSEYYELRPCRARTSKLRRLLSECPYRGPEYEAMESGHGMGEEEEEEEEEDLGIRGDRKKLKLQKKVSVFNCSNLYVTWHVHVCMYMYVCM